LGLAQIDVRQNWAKTDSIEELVWWFARYPLVICYIAIENGPFIVDFPMRNGDFP